jgi:hypothetical protein
MSLSLCFHDVARAHTHTDTHSAAVGLSITEVTDKALMKESDGSRELSAFGGGGGRAGCVTC